jgi:hypothetical protein
MGSKGYLFHFTTRQELQIADCRLPIETRRPDG